MWAEFHSLDYDRVQGPNVVPWSPRLQTSQARFIKEEHLLAETTSKACTVCIQKYLRYEAIAETQKSIKIQTGMCTLMQDFHPMTLGCQVPILVCIM